MPCRSCKVCLLSSSRCRVLQTRNRAWPPSRHAPMLQGLHSCFQLAVAPHGVRGTPRRECVNRGMGPTRCSSDRGCLTLAGQCQTKQEGSMHAEASAMTLWAHAPEHNPRSRRGFASTASEICRPYCVYLPVKCLACGCALSITRTRSKFFKSL